MLPPSTAFSMGIVSFPTLLLLPFLNWTLSISQSCSCSHGKSQFSFKSSLILLITAATPVKWSWTHVPWIFLLLCGRNCITHFATAEKCYLESRGRGSPYWHSQLSQQLLSSKRLSSIFSKKKHCEANIAEKTTPANAQRNMYLLTPREPSESYPNLDLASLIPHERWHSFAEIYLCSDVFKARTHSEFPERTPTSFSELPVFNSITLGRIIPITLDSSEMNQDICGASG